MRNENMVLAIAKMISRKAIDLAKAAADQDNFAEAKANITDAINEMNRLILFVNENKEILEDLNEITQDLENDLKRISNRTVYLQSSKYALCSRQMEMNLQRAISNTEALDEICDDVCTLSVKATTFNKRVRKMNGSRFETIQNSVNFLNSRRS